LSLISYHIWNWPAFSIEEILKSRLSRYWSLTTDSVGFSPTQSGFPDSVGSPKLFEPTTSICCVNDVPISSFEISFIFSIVNDKHVSDSLSFPFTFTIFPSNLTLMTIVLVCWRSNMKPVNVDSSIIFGIIIVWELTIFHFISFILPILLVFIISWLKSVSLLASIKWMLFSLLQLLK